MPSGPVYKICTAGEWAEAEILGHYTGGAVDIEDGFIHFSTVGQIQETANCHFAGQSGLVLVTVDPARLPAELKWERSRGGDLFPHLYGPLPADAATAVQPMPMGDEGIHILPGFQSG